MKAYIDRILVEELNENKDNPTNWNTGQAPPLRKVRIVSAGDSPDGTDNSELEGKEVYIKGELVGLPVKDGDRTLYLFRLYQIEIIN